MQNYIKMQSVNTALQEMIASWGKRRQKGGFKRKMNSSGVQDILLLLDYKVVLEVELGIKLG